jgi:hypothetical protein
VKSKLPGHFFYRILIDLLPLNEFSSSEFEERIQRADELHPDLQIIVNLLIK